MKILYLISSIGLLSAEKQHLDVSIELVKTWI